MADSLEQLSMNWLVSSVLLPVAAPVAESSVLVFHGRQKLKIHAPLHMFPVTGVTWIDGRAQCWWRSGACTHDGLQLWHLRFVIVQYSFFASISSLLSDRWKVTGSSQFCFTVSLERLRSVSACRRRKFQTLILVRMRGVQRQIGFRRAFSADERSSTSSSSSSKRHQSFSVGDRPQLHRRRFASLLTSTAWAQTGDADFSYECEIAHSFCLEWAIHFKKWVREGISLCSWNDRLPLRLFTLVSWHNVHFHPHPFFRTIELYPLWWMYILLIYVARSIPTCHCYLAARPCCRLSFLFRQRWLSKVTIIRVILNYLPLSHWTLEKCSGQLLITLQPLHLLHSVTSASLTEAVVCSLSQPSPPRSQRFCSSEMLTWTSWTFIRMSASVVLRPVRWVATARPVCLLLQSPLTPLACSCHGVFTPRSVILCVDRYCCCLPPSSPLVEVAGSCLPSAE